MGKIVLTKKFYQRDTRVVAKDLLGKYLCRKIGKKVICGKIIETEAYRGENDLACHASRGRTKRTETMYGEAGRSYIYLCYGMYWMLNIVTEQKNFPAAVLIRALEPASSLSLRGGECPRSNLISYKLSESIDSKSRRLKAKSYKLLSGPGKLTKNLQITGKLNGEDLTVSKELWAEDRGVIIKKSDIISSPRIGVNYAKHSALWPWRFYLQS